MGKPTARQQAVAPLIAALEAWMLVERGKLSRHAEVVRAMDYILKRWPAFTRFIDDGRICMSNNAAESARCAASPSPQGLAVRRLGPGR